MTQRFVYRSQGKQHGPVTADELRTLAASGGIQRTDLVAKEGADKWVAAMAIEGLYSRPTAAAAHAVGAPGPRSTAELLRKDLENITSFASRVLPSQQTRDLFLSRAAVLAMSLLAFSLACLAFSDDGTDLVGLAGKAMILWNFAIPGTTLFGTFTKNRVLLVRACQMSFGSWLFLLGTEAPLLVALLGTAFSAAAGYWGLTVLNRTEVKAYYERSHASPKTTVS